MKNIKINLRKTVISGFSGAAQALPAALAVGACSGFGLSFGLVSALLSLLFVKSNGGRITAPGWLSFLIFSYITNFCGVPGAFISLFAAGILVALISLISFERLKALLFAPVSTAFMIGSAFAVTVLQTTNYFGIGADGNDVMSMLRSYRSLGFHGNWRGVLYGTIVMVIMITFPRKFKKHCSTHLAAFIALIVTTALNFGLNPVREMTAITEVGGYNNALSALFTGSFSVFGLNSPFGNCSLSMLPLIALGALAMAAGIVYESVSAFENALVVPDKRYFIACGAVNTLSALLGGTPCTALYSRILGKNSGKNSQSTEKSGALSVILSGIISALLILAVFVFCEPLVSRIPVHSLAVVLIVAAWQSIGWRGVTQSFTSGRFSLIIFIALLLLTVLSGSAAGILATVILSFAVGTKKGVRGRHEKELKV